jgi:hypothetical protein
LILFFLGLNLVRCIHEDCSTAYMA